jgi:hypothetical protein
MLKTRVLRRIFGSKRQKFIGSRRNSRKDQLHNLNAESYTVMVTRPRSMGLVGHVPRTEEMRNTSIILAGKSERKKPL